MFLVAQQRYDEAKKAIKHMFHKDYDHEKIFEYLVKNTSRETDRASICQVICD